MILLDLWVFAWFLRHQFCGDTVSTQGSWEKSEDRQGSNCPFCAKRTTPFNAKDR